MFLTVLAVLFLALCLHYCWNVRQFSNRNIPFSWPIPIIGNNFNTLFRRLVFPLHILDLYNRFNGLPFAGIFDFTNRAIIIRDPELIKLITVKDFDHFTDHRTVIPEDVEPMVGKNLVSLKGQKWKTARNTVTPAFTASKMKFMYQLVSECGRQLTRHIDRELQQQECEVLKLEMKDLYSRFANDVVASAAFGISCNSLKEQDNEFYKMGRKVTNFNWKTLLRFMVYMMVPKIAKLVRLQIFPEDAMSFFKHLIHDAVKTREENNIIRPDMIHLLLEAKKVQIDLTDEDIAAHAFTFFFAGFETSSTLLSFTTLLLAMHPDIQKKLQANIDETFNYEEQNITYEALHGMTYLDMVISETLRLYAPASASDRKCVKSYTVPPAKNRPSLTIKKGEIIWLPIIGLHRNPEYFPDPESFQPERFSEENKHNIKPFTYLPFGVGPRNCIGNRFALMQVKTAIVHLLSKYDVHVVDKTPLPIKLTNTMGVEGGFWVGLTPRNTCVT